MRTGTESAPPASNVVDGPDGRMIQNVSPASGKPLPPVAVASDAQVQEAVRRAREAQRGWAASGWRERKRRLLRFRDALNDNLERIADIIVLENGKAPIEAKLHEVLVLMIHVHHLAMRAERILRGHPVHLHLFWPLKRSRIEYDPRGVVGVIAPWNFPLNLGVVDAMMAIAAGNAAVLKPSEYTPLCALRAKEIFDESGMDPDLLQVVPGDGATGAALVRSGVDMVMFTGSVASGRKVAAACGERLIPCVTELGGKDVAIVLPDADLGKAVRRVALGGVLNAGQACAGYERILVHRSLFDPFVRELTAFVSELRVGDGTRDPNVEVGAITMPDQLQTIERHVEDARTKGATIHVGGQRLELGEGRFYAPTVLTGVTDDMACWREESFGPIIPVRAYDALDEAVTVANDTPYGLTAYVLTGSSRHGEAVARQLHVGSVIINDMPFNKGLPEAPWGGVKESGLGRIGGVESLRALCHPKHINGPRFDLELPWGYPYRGRNRRFVRFLRWLLRDPQSRLV